MKTRRRTPASPVARRTLNSRWLSAAVLLAVAAFATVAIRAQVGTQVLGGDEANPNFDIRTFKLYPRLDEVRAAADYLDRFSAPQRAERVAADRFDGGVQLAAAVPGVSIDDHVSLGTTEVVGVAPGGAFLTAAAPDREATLRGFLATYAGVYGLAASEVADLALVSDYLNPAGNMGWVELEQRFNGIPVFQGHLRGGFTAKGALAGTTGVLAAGIVPEELTDTPAVAAEQAVALAASTVGWKVTEPALTRKSAVNGKVTLAGPGMAGDATAWLVYFPLKAGVVRLAWATQILGDPEGYLTVLDADDGTMLFRKNTTEFQTQAATYNVYTSDSPAPSSPTTFLPGSGTQAPFVARSSQTLIGNEGVNSFNNLGWITDGGNATDGNNVEAGLDLVAPDGVDATVSGTARVFNFAYDPEVDAPTTVNYRNGDVTNMFYWVNRYHDLTYVLGFTEAAFNFQNDNFGRGGAGLDRVSAETQDASGTNNANFNTPADGGRGRMQMFVWNGPTPDRSGGLDQDVIIHELTHGLSNRLHGNASGLSNNMARGMGEGWSDFYARSLLSTPDEDANGIFSIGGWATHQISSPTNTSNYYYGIRRFPYAVRSNVGTNGRPHSPLTFADIDSTQADLTDGAFPRGPVGVATVDQVHNIGEVWGGMLWEVRARFITRLGFAGNQRLLQIVTDGMKLDLGGPTMLQARNSIIAAANAGAGTPAERAADVADIWAGFATRGMGFSAQITNAGTGASNTRVVEAFDIPGVNGTTATLASESIPNGHLDPGEFAGVSFCMTNSGAATSGAVTGTLLASGGVLTPSAAQSFGTLAPGANACRTFTFVVSGACGATVTLSIQAVEAGGATKTFVYTPLEIGVSAFAQNFDGVVAPALPAGWTTSTLSGTVNLWVTNATAPDTAPNRAFAADPTTVSDNVLLSPSIALPAGVNRVSFRNNFATEASFDGGVLELSIAGGAFADVITAGGSFVSGGYNGLISTAFASPIGGRQAWTGTSAGYITSVVNLPAGAGGQNVQLRWRMASDNSVAATGWAVDTISVGGFSCGGASIPAPVAVNDAYAVAFNTALSVPAPGVLANDTGTGPFTASIGADVTHGTLALAADGSFTYTPAANYIGLDSFTYRATNVGGPSGLATVSLTVNGPTNAQPPTGLRVSSMVGNVVTFRWDPPPLGPAATGFVLEAGLTPGSVLASLPLGSVPSFTVAAPSASFFVRIHTLAAADRSAASNEIAVHVGVPVPPSAPGNLLATVSGDALTLAWTNTFGGAAPTGLVIDVSGAVSGSVPIGLSDTFAVGGVPAGTYTLSLRAVNGAGVSPSSNPVTVTLPGACSGAPLPPASFLAFGAGNTVFLGWDTAASGPAPSSFVIAVTGSFVGSVPITGRGVSGAVPAGTYAFSLQAVNACGGSAFTAAQTVVIP